jgi:hypothetical protein
MATIEVPIEMSISEMAAALILSDESPFTKRTQTARACYNSIAICDRQKVILEIISITNGRVPVLTFEWLMENTTNFPIIAVPAKEVSEAEDKVDTDEDN